MTKKIFLSRRLAYLLTTAIVSISSFQNNAFATAYTDGQTVSDADLLTGSHTIADTVIVSKAATNATFTILDTGILSFTGGTNGFTFAPALNADALDSTTAILITTTNTTNPTTGIVTFSGAIGTTVAIDTITLGTATDLAGSAIFSSNVVATTIAVQGADVNEPSTANFKGNVTAAITMTVGGANEGLAKVVYSGTTDQTQTGAITAAGDGVDGDLSITNAGGTVTFSAGIGTDALKLTSTTIDTGAKAVFNGAVAANTLTVTGTAAFLAVDNESETIAAGENSKIYLGKAITNGLNAFNEIAGARPTLTTGSQLYMPVNLTGGQTIVLFKNETNDSGLANHADTVTQVNAALQNNALNTYTSAAGAQTNVVTSTKRTDQATANELGVNLNKGKAIGNAYTAILANNASDTGAYTAIEDAFFTVGLDNAFTSTTDTGFTNQVSPQTDTITGSTIAAKAVTSGVQNVMASRLASLRSGDAYSTGVVTGNGMSANSGFIQAFGSTVEQKNKGNEFGYDADTTGFAIGVDGKVDGGAVIGISYARSEADVDGKGTGRAKNDITTDSVSLYADYATKDGYIEGSITYGQSENKGSRIINTAGLDRTYSSDYDSEQYSFRLSGGIPQSVGTDAFITPFATATISQIKADAYTERSTTADDSLRLRVSQDTVDSQVGSIGVKYHQVIKDGNTTFTPEIKVAVNQEFGDGSITTTNTYQGGGASFKNSTDVEKTSGTAGIGLSIESDNITFNISYDVDVKDKYLGHGAQAKLSAKF